MVAVTVAGFHVEVGGGGAAGVTGGLDGEGLGGLGALGVEEALAGDGAGGSGDDAAEVGVGGGEAGRHVCELGGAADEGGVARGGREGGVEVGIVERRSGFAENGRGISSEGQRHWRDSEREREGSAL